MKPKWSRLGGIVPTYQYACTECGGQLEAVQKFTDEALTVHEDCGGRLRKVFSPVGIVFKGSGFYRTDSRGSGPSSSGNGSSAASDSPAKTDSPAKAGGDSSSSSTAASTPPSSSSGPSAASASSKSSEKVA